MKTMNRDATESIHFDQGLHWRDLPEIVCAPPVADLADHLSATPRRKGALSVRDLLARFWAWLLEPGVPAQLTVRVPDGWYPPVL